MVYRNEHFNCNKSECKNLTAYVRIEGKWTRVGHYGSECKQFESLDLQKDRLDAEKRAQIDAEKQENRIRSKIIENELNMNESFFQMN